MNERIIRLQPKEAQRRIELFDFEKNTNLFVEVHREKLPNNDVKGVFIRYPRGVSVIINDNLSPREQAFVIKRLINGANVCIDSVIGMIKGNDDYKCECNHCLNFDI